MPSIFVKGKHQVLGSELSTRHVVCAKGVPQVLRLQGGAPRYPVFANECSQVLDLKELAIIFAPQTLTVKLGTLQIIDTL